LRTDPRNEADLFAGGSFDLTPADGAYEGEQTAPVVDEDENKETHQQRNATGIAVRPTIGSKNAAETLNQSSITACPRVGMTLGRPTSQRMNKIRIKVTNQLVTMELVTAKDHVRITRAPLLGRRHLQQQRLPAGRQEGAEENQFLTETIVFRPLRKGFKRLCVRQTVQSASTPETEGRSIRCRHKPPCWAKLGSFITVCRWRKAACLRSPVASGLPTARMLSRNDAVGCRAAACRRAVLPMNCGPAVSAGPTHNSVITGIIRKARSDCMDPAMTGGHTTNGKPGRAPGRS